LYGRYIGSRDLQPQTPRIAAYVRALVDRYPDITSDDGEDSPWADGRAHLTMRQALSCTSHWCTASALYAPPSRGLG
jgi:hypothetical protein